ncbi:hypothetical protein [Phenylobacterium sp.]|jgi:hypothetical protein|uniref:hypothetical protein n=1 Tax=Phenylobacterium sp. TaxID=1871053 RepID=UPI002F3E4E9E
MSHPPIESGADDISAHPRHTGHRWIDLTLALSAIFISAVSLAVAIEHGRTERDLVAANSWPFIGAVMANQYSTEGGRTLAAIGVSNSGVGPAKIQSFEVFYRGEPASSGRDLLRRCCGLGPDEADIGRHFEVTDRTVLRAGEAKATFGVWRDTPVGQAFASHLTDFTFRTCYCSILDQCWISNMRDLTTAPVKACPDPKVRFDPLH